MLKIEIVDRFDDVPFEEFKPRLAAAVRAAFPGYEVQIERGFFSCFRVFVGGDQDYKGVLKVMEIIRDVKDAFPFGVWLDDFIDKRDLDRGHVFQVDTGLNRHSVEFQELIDTLKALTGEEQALTRKLLTLHPDAMDFFKHQAARLAMNRERLNGERRWIQTDNVKSERRA